MQTVDLLDQAGERLRCGKPILKHNMSRGPPQHRIPHLIPWEWALFLFLSRALRRVAWDPRRRADSDSGGRGRAGGTSEASLDFNKRADQTCSLPAKENIILENGRAGWCRRKMACYVPILSFSAIALIWFQGSVWEIENKCAAFDSPPLMDLSSFLLFHLFLLPCFWLEFFPGCPWRWKVTFLVPPKATRPP